MSATETNSRPGRKQLSDQLDRLDTILDALADESIRRRSCCRGRAAQ
jgi:hypothetical protein